MPNISKKTAYDVKEASDQSLSKSARKHYAENAQAGSKDDSPMSKYGSHSPMKMGGSFMSKHSQSGFQQARDLMQDMPIDKHASALNQGVKEEDAVMKSRKKNIAHHQDMYDAFDKKAQGFKATSKKQVDGINSRYSDLAANVNTRTLRHNKSADSINKVRKSRKSQSDKDFDKLMNKSPVNQGTKLYSDRKNEKGQSQSDVFNLRQNQVNKAVNSYNDQVYKANKTNSPSKPSKQNFYKAESNQKRTIDSLNTANKKMNTMFSNLKILKNDAISQIDKKRKDILSGKY